ncbi:integrase [Nonomuraea turkmeniaca]|uniref:Integrase n=1 Tax=Nonomuraea turkmeniaca TaxID=103838 RepID=A0A5S4EXE1_9ACTN|nr:tyrosine-type recombinase/integrase [Nonomuraea turkmeniaca]TMR08159.1 integrase [Nonomuraea turkmeniaca]
MNTLRQAAEEYLAMRRGLGYKLLQDGRLLGQFVSFAEEHGLNHVTVEAALTWAMLPTSADPSWWAKRLTVVRVFSRHLAALDERTEVPPEDLLPRGHERSAPPFLYSPEQIIALITAAGTLASPLRAATFTAFVGLMAVAGLRTGEAMALDRDEADLTNGVLTIRDTKFGKSRLVPLHHSTIDQLRNYALRRDELCPRPHTPAFFLSGAGTRLIHINASKTFNQLLTAAGIQAPPGAPKPRLYDLRHTFAVSTLITWYSQGRDVAHLLPSLSTYMGHISPATTYWYLHACPELIAAAAGRLDDAWKEPA